MPLPLVLGIGAAVTTGLTGLIGAASASAINEDAKELQETAQDVVQHAKTLLEQHRTATLAQIQKLGQTKLSLLSHEMQDFLDVYTKLKEAELKDSAGLQELAHLNLTPVQLSEMREFSEQATSLIKGGLAGIGSGVLIGWGVYGGVSTLATAGSGALIGSLHGVAATNATLAWLGGGTLAAGGLGVTGGSVILGGLVAGPMLLIMGNVANAAATKHFDDAYSNLLEAKTCYEQACTACGELKLIASSAVIINANLKHLGKRLRVYNARMQAIVSRCADWKQLNRADQETIAAAVKYALEVKAFIDMPLLTEDGVLTAAAKRVREAYVAQATQVYRGEPQRKITMQEIQQWKKQNVNAPEEAMYIIDPLVNRSITQRLLLPDIPPDQYVIFASVNKKSEEISCYATVERKAIDLVALEKGFSQKER